MLCFLILILHSVGWIWEVEVSSLLQVLARRLNQSSHFTPVTPRLEPDITPVRERPN